MGIQIQGNSGTIVEVDGTTFRTVRVTCRPVEYGALGFYRVSLLSGNMAAGLVAASEIFQIRWSNSSILALVWGISIDSFGSGGAAFAGGFGNVNLTIARNWSADGSGGAVATLTQNNNKLRSSMGTSLMGTVRISTTAALGAGTKTLDARPFAQIGLALSTFTYNQFTYPVLVMYGNLEEKGNPSPIVLANNEGIVGRATVTANGTWQFGMTVVWAEVTSY